MVLEDKYGIDYAVDYIVALKWEYWIENVPVGIARFIVDEFYKCVSLGDNPEATLAVGYILMMYEYKLEEIKHSFKDNVNLSIEMYSRTAALWKRGLVDD